MARNGSGTFVRLYNWVTDRDNSIKITASRMDDEMDGMATALTGSLATDGQSTMSGNIKMGSNKVTGMGTGTARTDAATVGQIQDEGGKYYTTTGSSNTYAITPSPAITSYAGGQLFYAKANHANTGAATLNVSGLGATAIKKNHDQDLASGDIESGQIVALQYDGTNFQLLSPTAVGSFENPLTTRGDVIVQDASSTTRLAVGAANTVLRSDGTDPGYGKVQTGDLSTTLINGMTGITTLEDTDQLTLADNSDSNSNKKIAVSDFKTTLAATTTSAGFVEKATSAEVAAQTADKYPDAAGLINHPCIPKVIASIDGTGTPSILYGVNLSSITDEGTGELTLNFGVTFADTNYVMVFWCRQNNSGDDFGRIVTARSDASKTTTSVTIKTVTASGASLIDSPEINVAIYGALA